VAPAAFYALVKKVGFRCRVVGYSSLDLEIDGFRLQALAEFFDRDFESFRVFFGPFLYRSLASSYNGHLASSLAAVLSFPDSFKADFESPRLASATTAWLGCAHPSGLAMAAGERVAPGSGAARSGGPRVCRDGRARPPPHLCGRRVPSPRARHPTRSGRRILGRGDTARCRLGSSAARRSRASVTAPALTP
jgi:hypothetical protein